MNIIYLGDEQFQPIQEQQVATLKERVPDLQVLFWTPSDLAIFSRLDALVPEEGPLLLFGSRLGAIPAVHWTARNPRKVRRQILLHPSLHLSVAGLPVPAPHFVPTMIVHHTKEGHPSYDQLAPLAGKLFLDYSLHLTPEAPEMPSTLSLMALEGQ